MIKNKKLLSKRYSKNFITNKINNNKISKDVKNLKTVSYESCPQCGHNEASTVSEVDRTGFFCDTVICNNCELVFNDSYLSDENNYYKELWGKDRWGVAEKSFINRTNPDAFSWKRFAYVLSKIEEKFYKIKSVMEIGCGDGCNLFPYHLAGKKVTGFDFDETYLSPGRKKGMNLINGNFSDSNDKYDLIMLIHTFEHMQNLDEVVKNVFNTLNEEGYVYVEVPGIRNWNMTSKNSLICDGFMSSNNFLSYIQYQHNFHFDFEHLLTFWQRNGFQFVYGDEWARLILQKGTNKFKKFESKTNIFDYLKKVENDFTSISNISLKLMKKIYKFFYNK